MGFACYEKPQKFPLRLSDEMIAWLRAGPVFSFVKNWDQTDLSTLTKPQASP